MNKLNNGKVKKMKNRLNLINSVLEHIKEYGIEFLIELGSIFDEESNNLELISLVNTYYRLFDTTYRTLRFGKLFESYEDDKNIIELILYRLLYNCSFDEYGDITAVKSNFTERNIACYERLVNLIDKYDRKYAEVFIRTSMVKTKIRENNENIKK